MRIYLCLVRNFNFVNCVCVWYCVCYMLLCWFKKGVGLEWGCELVCMFFCFGLDELFEFVKDYMVCIIESCCGFLFIMIIGVGFFCWFLFLLLFVVVLVGGWVWLGFCDVFFFVFDDDFDFLGFYKVINFFIRWIVNR